MSSRLFVWTDYNYIINELLTKQNKKLKVKQRRNLRFVKSFALICYWKCSHSQSFFCKAFLLVQMKKQFEILNELHDKIVNLQMAKSLLELTSPTSCCGTDTASTSSDSTLPSSPSTPRKDPKYWAEISYKMLKKYENSRVLERNIKDKLKKETILWLTFISGPLWYRDCSLLYLIPPQCRDLYCS